MPMWLLNLLHAILGNAAYDALRKALDLLFPKSVECAARSKCIRVLKDRKNLHGSDVFRALQLGLDDDDRYFVEIKVLKYGDQGLMWNSYHSFVDDLLALSPGHHVLLKSAAGMGKTTLLIRLWDHCCTSGQAYPPTIYVPLIECGGGLLDYIEQRYQISRLELLAASRVVGKPDYLLLLDGLNELDALATKTSVLAELSQLFSASSRCVVTARTEQVLDSRFISYTLEMGSAQVDKYCDRFGLSPAPEMRKILTTPLMLALYMRTYNMISGYDQRAVRELDFRGVDEGGTLVAEGEVLWNFFRAQILTASPQLSEHRRFLIDTLLPAVAYRMSNGGVQGLTQAELDSEVRRLGEGHFSHPDLVRMSILDDAFMINRMRDRVSFSHQEFKSFFAAVHLVNEAIAVVDGKRAAAPLLRQPPQGVRRYFVGIVNPALFLEVLERPDMQFEAKAMAAMIVGDIYYYRASMGYPSRLTEGLSDDDLLSNAQYYYELCADYGDPMGHWNLGIVHRDRYEKARLAGSRPDMERYGAKVLEHTEVACARCLPFGYNQMGTLYLLGIGVEMSIENAKYWFEKGMQAGVAHSYNRMGQTYENLALEEAMKGNMKRAQEHYVQAFRYLYDQSVRIGEEWGMNRVTCYYYDGIPKMPKYDEKKQEACDRLGTFDLRYLSRLPNEPEYKQLLRNPDATMQGILFRAAGLQDPFAIERFHRLSKEGRLKSSTSTS